MSLESAATPPSLSEQVFTDAAHGLPDFEKLSAEQRIRWAVDTYGDKLILTTSFGIQSAVLLHMATQIKPDIPVVFADTQYLFPETYQFAETLRQRLNLNLHIGRAPLSAAWQEALHGKRWEGDKAALDAYNLENKVEPVARIARELGAKAWLSGLRREQSDTRADRPAFEQQKAMAKIYPLIDWTARDIYQYLKKHDLPYHPLWEKGYVSVGDWHSSQTLEEGMREQDTRFGGKGRECGLHDLGVERPLDWVI